MRALAVALATVMSVLGPGAAAFATTPSGAAQALILAFDTSGSVNDDDFEDAKTAVAAIAGELADEGVPVGVVAFAETAQVALPPSTDSVALRDTIGGLTNDGRFTAAFDAVEMSTDLLGPLGGGVALFITDGIDTDQDRDRAAGAVTVDQDLLPRVTGAAVVVSAINIQDGQEFSPDFTALVTGSGGTFGDVSEAADLVPVLEAELDQAVQAIRAAGPLNTTAAPAPVASPAPTAPTGAVAAAPSPARPELWPREVAWWAAGGMFAAAVLGGLVLSGIAGRASSPEIRRQKALEAYTPVPDRPAPRPPAAPTRLGDNVVARQAVDVAGRLIDRGDAEKRLAQRLEAADLVLRPGEWVVIQACISVVVGLVLLILTLGNPLAAILGIGLGVLGTTMFIRLRADRRHRAFHAALPDTLQLLASTLRVGHSLPQAMDSVVREGQEPIRTEFQRALVEARLGVPAEKSLDDIAERVGSEDFRWVVMSIRIQREVGGNLAELLDTVAETIRERERLRRHVSALSAEGRLSAWIVGALPVVFILYLLVARPDYLTPLVTDPLGIVLLVVAVGLFTVGVFGLRWATKVDL